MSLKVVVLACVAVVALCDKAPVYAPPPPAYAPAPYYAPEPAYHAPEPAYHAPAHHEPEYPDVPPKYNYNYGVADGYSGANFGHTDVVKLVVPMSSFHVNKVESLGYVVVLACVAVVALCDKAPVYAPPPPAYAPAPYHAPEPAYHAPAHYEPEYPDVPPKYNYNYGVADGYSGANFGHTESRDVIKTPTGK
ncbi:uncharacterized protein LOC134778825 [Penaeus indicus]|uniref:uncharacterized protein LOC134778825 n=1 Tax=Penaeus indicus TaxID=29960 RepID=UPI00300D29C9